MRATWAVLVLAGCSGGIPIEPLQETYQTASGWTDAPLDEAC